MPTQPSVPKSREVSLVWIILLLVIGPVVIVGAIEAIDSPDLPVHGCGTSSNVRSQLQTIRSQIELYNVQNPVTPYDQTTAAGPAFWDPLVQKDYLQAAPANPLQHNSTVVGATPAMGTGWVWAPWADMVHADDGLPFYVLCAVDEDGNFYRDPDTGQPY
jgi:hypothetical protein